MEGKYILNPFSHLLTSVLKQVTLKSKGEKLGLLNEVAINSFLYSSIKLVMCI